MERFSAERINLVLHHNFHPQRTSELLKDRGEPSLLRSQFDELPKKAHLDRGMRPDAGYDRGSRSTGCCPHRAPAASSTRSSSTSTASGLGMASGLPPLGRRSLCLGTRYLCGAAAARRALGAGSLGKPPWWVCLDRRTLAIEEAGKQHSKWPAAQGLAGHFTCTQARLKPSI